MKKVLLGVFAAAFLFSCSNSDDSTNDNQGETEQGFRHGYIVVNEGGMNHNNASVSYILPNMSRIQTNIFSKNNGGEMVGDVLQSITFDGDLAYIVMNNSNVIHIVNRYTFKKEGELSGEMTLPRYAAVANDKLYVTNQGDVLTEGDEFITVYNLEDNSFIKRIDVDIVAEEIFANDNYLYVGSGPWASDSKVEVFDLSNDQLINTIELENTISGMVKNSGDGIYVLESSPEKSTISKIDGSTLVKNVVTTSARNAQFLVLNNGYLYTVANNNQVFRINATMPDFPSSPIFSVNYSNYLYGFNVINGNVFIADTDFASESSILIYNMQGDFIKWLPSGVGTSKFYKN
ncbi:MAG TPA: DUF5074 domain-containing protein [Flavobacterium sp.]|nr:DUF5074 domain-containing protein [Flavobacterium sp.]